MISRYLNFLKKSIIFHIIFLVFMSQHPIRNSTFEELLARNVKKPQNIIRIKRNIREILAILMNGYGFEGISSFCMLTGKETISRNVYYDYLHLIDIVLRKLAEDNCNEKLEKVRNTHPNLVVGFDASWGHPRDANNCLGILMDLQSMLILCFHLVHHGREEAASLSSTQKHAKCMEKISLSEIIERSQLNDISNLTFIHDCDLTDHNLIREKLPNSNILYDPNHLVKKTKKIINQICTNDEDLKYLTEKIENYYSILMHDKTISLNEKIDKWKNVTNYFIETEDLSLEYNSTSIEKLEKLISDISDTFDQILPQYSTNPIESFNHARSSIASKNIAYRITWRIRAYISIIKWNEPYWKKKIFESFNITLPNHIQKIEIKKNEDKKEKYTIAQQDSSRKERAIKRKKRKTMYKLDASEKMVHHYADEDNPESNSDKNKKKTKLSKFHKWIIEAVSSKSTEDKPYVSINTIINYMMQYHDLSKMTNPKTVIRSQITRMINNNILTRQRLAVKLTNQWSISNDQRILNK